MQAEELEREAPGLVAHGDSILQKVKEAYAPHKRLTESDLRDYIAGILVNTFEGTRFEPINGIDIEAYDVRLSPRAQAEFGHFRNLKADRKSVVKGKSVSERVYLGGRRIIKKK